MLLQIPVAKLAEDPILQSRGSRQSEPTLRRTQSVTFPSPLLSSHDDEAPQLGASCDLQQLGSGLNPKLTTQTLPEPQISYLVKDLYKEIILGNPKMVGYLGSR